MMRESVSHQNPQTSPITSRSTNRLQWCVLVGVAVLTILTGIMILMALMSPENLKTAPTIGLVCVLVLLCVPVPVLMLERSQRRAADQPNIAIADEPAGTQYVHASRQSVIHPPHIPHNAHAETHRTAGHGSIHERPAAVNSHN